MAVNVTINGTTYQIPTVGSVGWGASLTSFFQAVASALAPPSWTSVSAFLNSWVNYGGDYRGARYCKDAQGFVHVELTIKNGVLGLEAFVLPAGFRPLKDIVVPAKADNGVAGIRPLAGSILVTRDGLVVPDSNSGYNALVAASFSFSVN